MSAKPALRTFALLAVVACATSCKRDKPASAEPSAVIAAADNANRPVDKTPVPGVDVSNLDAEKQDTFYKLMGTLSSPCGKAHSLRTSVTSAASCRRGPFAARYVAALLGDGAPETFILEDFEKRYQGQPTAIDVSNTPKVGNDDAPIKIVEFFDYACPACQSLRPKLEKTLAAYEGRVVAYYKMFPLESIHPDSRSAAQAALAAQQQGKFHEMHEMLFSKAPAHKREDVLGYARALGLDAARFEADYASANAKIDADLQLGDNLGVKSTPTLFFNGRKYSGPHDEKYLGMWIEEELAVNR